MRFKFLLLVVVFLISGILFWYLYSAKQISMNTEQVSKTEGQITYISIGDSYTIGNGNLEENRWPNVLVQHLNEAGIPIVLAANPAVSGFTVEDAARKELPVVKQLQPDFVTVLIGTNDNFHLTPANTYEKELKAFLDELQSLMKEPKNIVLITIPDYSKSPAATGSNIQGVSESIQEYNKIIKSEAEKRGLKVADIFLVSQITTGADDYISDGLHPSAQGYAKWEKEIYPVVYEFLK